MAARKGQDPEGRLNPRLFQRHILQTVLADEGRNIADDAFPTRSLLDRLGGSEISAIDGQRLRERTGVRYERYLALTQLWAGGQLANPPPGVAEAFGLEPLAGFTAPPPPSPPPSPGKEKDDPGQPRPHIPPPPSKEQRQLAAWVDDGQLDQSVAQTIRVSIYDPTRRSRNQEVWCKLASEVSLLGGGAWRNR